VMARLYMKWVSFVNGVLTVQINTKSGCSKDAGVDAGVTTDFDSDPRPIGAGFDIGFDEVPLRIYLPLIRRSGVSPYAIWNDPPVNTTILHFCHAMLFIARPH
jgi:hypothetical protein